MVDRILGILDEIIIAAKSGVRINSSAGDRQILKAPFDAAREETRGTAVTTPEIPQHPEIEPVDQPRDTTRRPVILPGGQDEEISGDREGEILVAPSARSKRPAIQTSVEPKEIPGRTEFQSGVLTREIPEHPPEIQPGAEQKNIRKIPELQPPVLPGDRQETPVRQTVGKPETIPTRLEGQPRILSKKTMSPVENKLEVASIRKLQKNILRDLNMYDLNPDSFKRSQKNIDNIRIPKKADVNKKLSEAEEEMLDLNWLYE
jgi:hypothetical protein